MNGKPPDHPLDLIHQFRDMHCCPMSYRAFDNGKVKHNSFTLPVDDFLRSTARDVSPRILLGDGPHVYVRIFFSTHTMPDRGEEEAYGSTAKSLVSRAEKATAAVKDFVGLASQEDIALAIAGRLPWSLKRAWHRSEHQRKLDIYQKSVREIWGALDAIETLNKMARERCETSRVYTKRDTMLWKRDFAYWIGRLWIDLFGSVPTKGPSGSLLTFIDQVWASIDTENLCPQNWERTIRGVPDEINAELNQIRDGLSAQ